MSRYVPDLTPLPCCGHAAGCHECGLCQVVLNEGDYGASPIFCRCPENVVAVAVHIAAGMERSRLK